MDRYSKYQEEGDQFVGRCCAGLPQMDERFAIVGPFFKSQDAQDAQYLISCIKDFFPNCPPLLRKVAEFCLASLVYHFDYLNVSLAHNSPIRSTILFTQPIYMQKLKDWVYTSTLNNESYSDGDVPQATGIPPYILILKQNKTLELKLQQVDDRIQGVTNDVVEGVTQVLENRALQSNVVTPHGIQAIMESFVERILNNASHQPHNPLPQEMGNDAAENIPRQTTSEGQSFCAYDWGQLNFQPFPQGFSVPKGVVRTMWVHWMCENTSSIDGQDYAVRPLRRILHLKPRGNKQLIEIGKDLSALRNLMFLLELKARQHEDWNEVPTSSQAMDLYHNARLESVWVSKLDQLDTVHLENGRRKRRRGRLGQLFWKTVSKGLGSTRRQNLLV